MGVEVTAHRLVLRNFAVEFDAAVADALDIDVHLVSTHA